MEHETSQQETYVYGYIRDTLLDRSAASTLRRRSNREVLAQLPTVSESGLVYREMFAQLGSADSAYAPAVDVLPFGAYQPGVEYQWDSWIEQFESLLRRLYWSRVTVHLETLALGIHTFNWEYPDAGHEPLEDGRDENVQVVWARTGVMY